MKAFSRVRAHAFAASGFLGALVFALAATPVQAASWGINSPVTPAQRGTAQQVAAAGVPLSALAPNAPDEYTVKRGDTLWRISGLFLKSPWRWPELWGMNLQQIRNPHLIYPGQRLELVRVGGRAYLRVRGGGEPPLIRISPRNRAEMLDGSALPTIDLRLIEPFLAEPLVSDEETFQQAPRIVALRDDSRVLIAKGDRAYARGPEGAPLLRGPDLPLDYRVFRNATPLKDPVTGEVLGYEGQYVGQARLVRGETKSDEPYEEGDAAAYAPAAGEFAADNDSESEPRYLSIPATVDIVHTKEEIRAGDRLLPEPPEEFPNYAPHAPADPITARVVSVYGSGLRYVGGNQVVAINKGARDGVDAGMVLAILSSGKTKTDDTDGKRELIQLPDERNGLAIVFRVFDRVSYVLVMEVTRPAEVGDKLVEPL